MNKSESNPNMKENMLVVVSDFEAEAGAPFIDDKVTAGNWAKGSKWRFFVYTIIFYIL